MVFDSKLYRHTVVSAALLLVASCADAPTATTAVEHVEAVAATRPQKTPAVIVNRIVALAEDISTSTTVGPEGGALVLPAAGLVIYFPPGAVTETMTISATALKGSGIVYDFQPHGTTFAAPIFVTQQLAVTELNSPKSFKKRLELYGGYLTNGTDDILADGTANFAELFEAMLYGDGTERLAVFSTNHFSGYAMASGYLDVKVEVPGQ